MKTLNKKHVLDKMYHIDMKYDFNKMHVSKKQGQVIMATVMVFLVLSLTVVMGISLPISAQIKNSTQVLQTKKSVFAADAVAEDVLYRLNQGRVLPTNIILSMNDATSTAEITDISGNKQVLIIGESGSVQRSVKTRFVQSAGVVINYGLQVGSGGFEMTGGPTIYGNVYSNGNIIASGGSTVTGSAVAASVTAIDLEIDNTQTTATPWGNQTVGTNSGVQTIAQSFTVSTSTPITNFEFFVRKTGTPANAIVRIFNNNSGTVGTTQIGGNGALSAALVTTNYGYVTVYPFTPITLVPGVTYWLTVQHSGTNLNFYTFGMNNNQYPNGTIRLKNRTGSYFNSSPTTQDINFRVFTGGLSAISGITINGNANAGIVNNSSIGGNLFCESGEQNNKSCDTSQPIPSPLGFPISNSNIALWKTEASSGSVRNSDWVLGGNMATSTNGPMRINGNLSIGAGATFTLGGPLYVTGKITITGGGKIILASSYGTQDEKIIAERMDLNAGGLITGNGQVGSYVVVIADGQDCPLGCLGMTNRVITASGGTGSVVLVAPNGTIEFTGGASAKSAVARKMILSGGTTLNYESGLSNISFISGASSGWNVESWKEIEQ